MCVVVIFDGELGFGVRSQVWHQFRILFSDSGENHQSLVGERQRQWHIFGRVIACVAEHHSLVACSLFVGIFGHYSAVYVLGLFVYGRDHAAGVPVEHVFGLVVAYPVYHFSGHALDVHVCIVCAYFTSYYHQSGAAECFACHLGFRVLTEKFIEYGV